MEKPEIHIFTDGSCPRPQSGGGWAYIIRLANGEEKRASGGEPVTTNNRQELMGPIMALKFLAKANLSCKIKLVSDSQYVIKGMSEWMPKWKKNGWKKKNYDTKAWENVMNEDLWKELDQLMKPHEIVTEWTRGHVGHPENEMCDKLAGDAASVYYEKK